MSSCDAQRRVNSSKNKQQEAPRRPSQALRSRRRTAGLLPASQTSTAGAATLQADREAGGLELLTRLQWRGEPGTDETLQQMRDVVAALVPNDSILSLRDCASELVAA